MKDSKKYIRLLSCLLCLVVCAAFLLTGCRDSEETPTEPTGPVVETTTEPETETTVGEETTEPDSQETTEEATEAPTESSGGSGIGNGTGGSYSPQVTEPGNDPTDEEGVTTEPVIEVPAAGVENNPYYENISDLPGDLSTVSIPANSEMSYVVKSAGAYLHIESADVSVVYNGKTYTPTEGVLELELPGSSEASNAQLRIMNKGAQAQPFAVRITAQLGAQSNPIKLEDITNLQVKLEKDDADGLHYTWQADASGVLTLGLSSVQPANAGAELAVTVNAKTVYLSQSENGLIQIPVSEEDNVLIQVVAKADGENSYPAITAVVNGSVSPLAQLQADEIPTVLTTDEIAPNKTVYYDVLGVNGTVLQIQDADAMVVINGTVYAADKNGLITIALAPDAQDEAVQMEITNCGETAKSFDLQFAYPVGHKNNPQPITQLGELVTTVHSGTEGYYYLYTAEDSGAATFHIQTPPDVLGVRTDITVLNLWTMQEESLWNEGDGGSLTQQEQVSVDVLQDEQLLICVRVLDMTTDTCVESELTVFGKLHAAQQVACPGFTAQVPVGEKAYYLGYNLDDAIFCLTGENVAVTHNGVTYIPAEGQIRFRVTAESRMPARFVVENRGDEDGTYEVTLSYLVGHAMNPDVLALGSSYVNQSAGAVDYYFRYTAPKAGVLKLTFDENAQWCYAADNLTQSIYGETHFSDDETALSVEEIAVQAGDVVQLRVNTYDPDAPWEAPAGLVSFTATLVTGPVEIEDPSQSYTASLLPGETGCFTGPLKGATITIANAQNAVATYNGTDYTADAQGNISFTFADPDSNGKWSFAVCNVSGEETEYTMTFRGKTGSLFTPKTLSLGNTSITLDAGADDYWFSYRAPKSGTLQLTFPENGSWSYCIGGGEPQYSGSNPSNHVATVELLQGETVKFRVNTYNPAEPENTPAGTVEFHGTLITGPVELAELTAGCNVTQIAGETVTYTGPFRGATITITNAKKAVAYCNGTTYTANAEGVLEFEFLQTNSDGQWEFSLLNGASVATSYTMTFRGETGSWLTPDVLKLGQSQVSRQAGDEDYYFIYQAPKSGELVLTFDDASHWSYIFNMEQRQYSTDENSKQVSLKVIAGDEIHLQVNTYDPALPDTVPEGNVAFHATLITGPVNIADPSQPTQVTMNSGESTILSGNFYGKKKLMIENAADLTVTVGETVYTADADGVIAIDIPDSGQSDTMEILLYCAAEEETSYILVFGQKAGTQSNPAKLLVGTNTAFVEAGSDGYYYTFTATQDCTIKLSFTRGTSWAFEAVDWWGNKKANSSGLSTKFSSVKISAGQTVTLIIKTYDKSNPTVLQGGNVVFTVEQTLV